MQLATIRIQNFRSFDDVTIDLADYNCFVGPNGAGKSAILAALNIFFRNTDAPTNPAQLEEEDFHFKNTAEPVVITATFTDLSEEAKKDFKHYVRQDRLIVSAKAVWNEELRTAEVKQHGTRRVIEQFAPYFKAEGQGAKAAELKEIYQTLRISFHDLPEVRTKADMYNALREYEEAHPENCTEQESDAQFYGWSRGTNLLAKYVQWVYIPAVKDAAEEQEEGKSTALGQLIQRTIRSKVDFSDSLTEIRAAAEEEYRGILDESEGVLSELSDSITKRLREWSHPGVKVHLKWHFDPTKSVVVNEPLARILLGEGNFAGALVRMGHGLQRSFLVSILHELAESAESQQPTLLLGIEEPELYQHPPQARHLADVLERLSSDDAQVLVTTHSPYFVSGRGFESVCMTRKNAPKGATFVSRMTHEDLTTMLASALQEQPASPTAVMAKVEQIMQPSQNELFFTRVPVVSR